MKKCVVLKLNTREFASNKYVLCQVNLTSREEDAQKLSISFPSFAISSVWKKDLPLILSKFKSFYRNTHWPKFDLNWPRSYLDKLKKDINAFALFCYYRLFGLTNWSSFYPRMICAKFVWYCNCLVVLVTRRKQR